MLSVDDVLDLTCSPETKECSASPQARLAPGSSAYPPETNATTGSRSRRKRARPAYLEAYDDGQCFDASQPTASQVVPHADSPEASFATAASSPQASEEPAEQDHSDLESPREAGEPFRHPKAQGVPPLQRGTGACEQQERASEADKTLSLAHAAGRHSAVPPDIADGEQGNAGPASVAADNSVDAAAGNDVEVLADPPLVPIGQPETPTSSSDLQLETFLGAAPAAGSAPATEIDSFWAPPARPTAGVSSAAVADSAKAQPANTAVGGFSAAAADPVRAQSAAAPTMGAALPRQRAAVREAPLANGDSDNEAEEPLWEPDAAPKAPPGGRARAKTAEERVAAAAAKELEKQHKKEARELARQEKAAQKEQEKQRKAQERLDRQRENGRTAQQDILPVLCPAAMNHATTLRIMERLRADDFTYEVNAGGALPLGRHGLCSMIWRRRVYRITPQAETIAAASSGPDDVQYEDVPYVLVYATGEKFVQLLERQSLEAFLGQVAATHPGCTLSLCLEGLQSYLRRRQNAEYRALGPGGGGFNAATFDEVLARLVLDHPGVRHRCVADAAEAADHISQLTKALATQPFRVQDSYLHQFGGSGKNSKSVKETLARYALRSRSLEPWFYALSYVVDISPPQAHAIVSQHPSLGQLMAIYADPSRTQKEKENLVAALQAPGVSQKVGPRASQKLHALFTATDPLMQLGELGFKG